MKTKHTPGPWKINQRNSQGDIEIIAPNENYKDGGFIAELSCDDKNTSANARLISAAPELLEACKFVLSNLQVSRLPQFRAETEILAEAIAKAEGK